MNQNITPKERDQLAEKIGMNPAYFYQCITGRRDLDPVVAVRLELENPGLISRFDLCTKRGAEIWPELWQKRQARLAAAEKKRATKAVAKEA